MSDLMSVWESVQRGGLMVGIFILILGALYFHHQWLAELQREFNALRLDLAANQMTKADAEKIIARLDKICEGLQAQVSRCGVSCLAREVEKTAAKKDDR